MQDAVKKFTVDRPLCSRRMENGSPKFVDNWIAHGNADPTARIIDRPSRIF
jgi:hypothetical protein